MNRELNDELIDYVIESADSQSLRSVWCNSVVKDKDFENQKEDFFWVLKKLLESGRFRLRKNGGYLTESPDEIVAKFRKVFPKTKYPYPGRSDLDIELWFYDPDCPGEAVWRYDYPDGRITWLDC